MDTPTLLAVLLLVGKGSHTQLVGGKRWCQTWNSPSLEGSPGTPLRLGISFPVGLMCVSCGPCPAPSLHVFPAWRDRVLCLQHKRAVCRPSPYAAGALGQACWSWETSTHCRS